jgi:hypothetical protein
LVPIRVSSPLVEHSLATVQKSNVEIRKEGIELNITGGSSPAINPRSSIRFMMFLCRCSFMREDFASLPLLPFDIYVRNIEIFQYFDRIPSDRINHN